MITLDTFKEILEYHSDWLKRAAKNKNYSLEHLKGIIDGTYRVLRDLLYHIELPSITNVKDSSHSDIVGYVKVFDTKYYIYLDDAGQSFYTKINDAEYAFGTYRAGTEIVEELISLVLMNHINIMFKEVEDIYNGKM